MVESAQVTYGKNKKRWPFWATVLVVLVVALGAGVGLYWWQNHSAPEAAQDTNELPPELVGLHNLRTGGDDAAFQAKVDELLAQPSLSKEALYGVYVQEGMHASEKSDYTSAIDLFKKAEQVDASYDIAQLIATTYQRAGDKTNALSYYKIARDRLPADSEMDRESINVTIEQLEASE
jgi:hypothetical protein